MSTVLHIQFLAGRYHATPWGHHVNEGFVEWPPSPWRLLRSLVATGFTKLGWNAPPEDGRELVDLLAGSLPTYLLPPASQAHSRHYLPVATLGKRGTEDTTLVIDAWANVDRERSLVVDWPLDLPQGPRNLLGKLARNLTYLGRAESWVEARLAEPGEPPPEGDRAVPVDPSASSARCGAEQIALLALDGPSRYQAWREDMVHEALAALPTLEPGGRVSEKRLRDRAKALEPYPATLVDCLCISTSWLREHGWSQPPGSRTALYWRQAGALDRARPITKGSVKQMTPIAAMLLALATPSRNEGALPPVTRTLSQGEILHRAMVSHLTWRGGTAPEIVGRDQERRPLVGHRHAHVVPLALGTSGHLDHVLIWAPAGLGADAQMAIRGIRRTFAKGIDALTLAVSGIGSIEDLCRIPDPYGRNLRRLVMPSRMWESVTPFVPPRFLKPRGRNTLEGQILAELTSRGFPEAEIEVAAQGTERAREFRHFIVQRRGRPGPPQASTFSVRLHFDEPQSGLICLGYGSHFGLGLFAGGEEVIS